MTSGIPGPNGPSHHSPSQDTQNASSKNPLSEIANSALAPTASPSQQIKPRIAGSQKSESSFFSRLSSSLYFTVFQTPQEKALDHLTKWLEQGNQPPLSKVEMDLVRPYLLQTLNLPYCLPALDNDVLQRLRKTGGDFIQIPSSEKRTFPSGKLGKILTFALQLVQDKEVLNLDEILKKKIKTTGMVQEEDEIFPIALELLKAAQYSSVRQLIFNLENLDRKRRREILPIVHELLKLAPKSDAGVLIGALNRIDKGKREGILSIVRELLKVAPRSDPGVLINALDEIDEGKREETLSIVHELLKVAPNSDAGVLINALKYINKRRREEISPIILELLKLSPHLDMGDLIDALNRIDEGKREEIFSIVRELLQLAPKSDTGILIDALNRIDEGKREGILSIVRELLKLNPNSDAGDLIDVLKNIREGKIEEIFSIVRELLQLIPDSMVILLINALIRIDEEKKEEALSIVRELLKLAPNSDAGILIYAWEAINGEESSEEILSIVRKLLKLAPNSDAGILIYALEAIDEEEREKISFILPDLLQAIPKAGADVFVALFVKTFPREEQESIRILVSKLAEAHPKATLSKIFSVIHNAFENERESRNAREEVCSKVLSLLEAAPQSNVCYLVTVLVRVYQATAGDKEEWEKIYINTLRWLKTDSTLSAGYLFSLMGDISKNKRGHFDDFLFQLHETFPESPVDDLLYSIHTLTPEERKELNVLLFEELPQLSEQPLSFKGIEGTHFVDLFKTNAAASLLLLQALKNQPDLEAKPLANQICALPQPEQANLCSFITSHLKRNPTADVFDVIKACKEIREGNSKLDMSAIKDFLPLLTPEQVREAIQAATEKEMNEALATLIYLRLANEYLSVEEALKMGIEQGIEVIEEGRKRGMDDVEGIRLITHFLDEFHPFTLSLAAKAFSQLIGHYRPFMQARHEAVVFPHFFP